MNTNSKLNRLVLVVALALFPLLASERASAQNATATLLSGGLSSISITSGQTFTLDINIVTTFTSVGITYFMQSNEVGAAFFRISARNIGASPYNDLITNDATAFTPPAGDLNPVNDFDLGAVIANPNIPLPAGSYFISTLTFTTLGMSPGVYHIFFDSRTIVADGQFNDHQVTANQFTVTIIPEPATAGLAVLGGVMLLAFVWRARRVMA